MTLVLPAVAALTAVSGVAWWQRHRSRDGLLARLRSEWGHPKAAPPDGSAGCYYRLTRTPSEGLDDTTWSDLALDDVFRWVDRTESVFGRECLYERLRVPRDRASLLRFEQSVERFTRDENARLRVQAACSGIEERSSVFAWEPLLQPSEPLPRWKYVLPLFSLTLLTLAALTVIDRNWLPAFAGGLAVGLLLRVKIAWRLSAVSRPLRAVGQLAHAARAIAAIAPPVGGSEGLRATGARLKRLERIASWLGHDPAGGNLGSLVLDYLNLLLALDGLALAFADAEMRRRRVELRGLAETVGDLEAAVAIASVRAESPGWTRPQFDDSPGELAIDDLRHPLVPSCVSNSIRVVAGQGIVLSGANMTGKSTFLRAVGANVVLAQTVHTVFARRYRAPWLRVRSCISPADDLLRAKSLYQREAETVVSMLADLESEGLLCLFDELFRGTNADDRLGATAALVRYLLPREEDGSNARKQAAPVFLLMATHDLDLVPLLADRTLAFHLGDEITEHGLVFDYRLQPGPTSSRNAIALLEFLGAPRVLVDEAGALARRASGKAETAACPTAGTRAITA